MSGHVPRDVAFRSCHCGRRASIHQGQRGWRFYACAEKSVQRAPAATQGKRVVITGSTKGVGQALAKEFLAAGDSVIVSSRSEGRVLATIRQLTPTKHAGATLKGICCNVCKSGDVAALANYAVDQLGSIDIWINNAGTNGYKYKLLTELEDNDLANIVETNVLGVMLGCREAIRVMQGQHSGGHIFNMDGAGADGGATPRFAAYGASKRGLVQLGKSLQAELKMLGVKNISIHNLSPGMVTTDLLMSGGDTKTAKFFINCLADPPEDVAAFLVPRIRKLVEDGSAASSYIKYLTKSKAYTQILARLLFGMRKDRFLKE